MPYQKPFSEACLRNQEPIAEVLATYISRPASVLELGSGTGQHGVFFARALPHLNWQPTELVEALPGIEAWRRESGLANLAPAIALDVNQRPWPFKDKFDAVFTANTVHFVAWETVVNLVEGAAEALSSEGLLLVYGPFNEAGRYTSEGNERLDQWLRQRDPESGIKDRQALIDLAAECGLAYLETHRLPANNALLSFRRA